MCDHLHHNEDHRGCPCCERARIAAAHTGVRWDDTVSSTEHGSSHASCALLLYVIVSTPVSKVRSTWLCGLRWLRAPKRGQGDCLQGRCFQRRVSAHRYDSVAAGCAESVTASYQPCHAARYPAHSRVRRCARVLAWARARHDHGACVSRDQLGGATIDMLCCNVS